MIKEFMEKDHQRCDRLFAEAESLVSESRWEEGESAFHEMREAIERHFSMEEKLFFPRFEAVSGMTMGPTQVMRQEHEQMRALFDDMEESLKAREADAYLGDSETLLIMMQQHNAKEEQVLYPMLDAHLAVEAERLIEEAGGIDR